MNLLLKVIISLMFLMSYTGFSQASKEQEMIDKTEKKRDSVTECITLDEMLLQVENKEKNKKSSAKFNNENNSLPKANEE